MCKAVMPDFFTLLLAALPVSSWITGVALHKLTRSDGTTNGGGRRLQSENIVHTVGTSNLELYLIINRVDHIEHFFRTALFSIFIKLHAIAEQENIYVCAVYLNNISSFIFWNFYIEFINIRINKLHIRSSKELDSKGKDYIELFYDVLNFYLSLFENRFGAS